MKHSPLCLCTVIPKFWAHLMESRYMVVLVVALFLGFLSPVYGSTTQKNNKTETRTQQSATPVNQHGHKNSLSEKRDTQQHDAKSLKQAIIKAKGNQGQVEQQKRAPQNAVQAEKLRNDLMRLQIIGRNEVGTPIAGAGTNKKLIQSNRLANEYGGKPGDWSKKTSSSQADTQGRWYAIHWYENTVTGERQEIKLVIDEAKNGRIGNQGG